jgi:hypothetical protein
MELIIGWLRKRRDVIDAVYTGSSMWRLGNVHTGLELKAEGLRNQTEKTGRTKLRVLGGEDQLTS